MNTVNLQDTQRKRPDWNFGDIVTLDKEQYIIAQGDGQTLCLVSLRTGLKAFRTFVSYEHCSIRTAIQNLALSHYHGEYLNYNGPCDITLTPKV